MPVAAADFFSPATRYVPFVLEDTYFKGGYRVFNTIADRDKYLTDAKLLSFGGTIERSDSRKPMMLCGVIETPNIIYKLDATKEKWEVLEFGTKFKTETPLDFIGPDKDKLSIDPNYLLPQEGRGPNKILTIRQDGSLGWELRGGIAGVRVTKTYQPLNSIEAGEQHNFELDLGMSVMLLHVELNTVDIELLGFTDSSRQDRNPYLFRSSIDFMKDEGMRYVDGVYEKLRRFAFMVNLSEEPNNLQYFSMKNVGAIGVKPTLKITALTLQ
jgi:hypothetical protein